MSASCVAIVDTGGANIASLICALQRIGVVGRLTRDPAEITSATHVILPGVGAAANAMQRIRNTGLAEVIKELRQPVLGICLGLHLLAQASEEQATPCLEIVPAIAGRLTATTSFPVPNTGWCRVTQKGGHALFSGIADGSYFYFVHSFAVPPGDFTLATASHVMPFTAVLHQRNFFAAQFHPERSAAAGSRFLQNFVGISS